MLLFHIILYRYTQTQPRTELCVVGGGGRVERAPRARAYITSRWSHIIFVPPKSIWPVAPADIPFGCRRRHHCSRRVYILLCTCTTLGSSHPPLFVFFTPTFFRPFLPLAECCSLEDHNAPKYCITYL